MHFKNIKGNDLKCDINRIIRNSNINKMKKKLKDYYKQSLKSYCGLPETVKRINTMTKKELYFEYTYVIYELPF